jgi:hypothetical protein
VFIHTKYGEPIVIMVFRCTIQKLLCLSPPFLRFQSAAVRHKHAFRICMALYYPQTTTLDLGERAEGGANATTRLSFWFSSAFMRLSLALRGRQGGGHATNKCQSIFSGRAALKNPNALHRRPDGHRAEPLLAHHPLLDALSGHPRGLSWGVGACHSWPIATCVTRNRS